ncbi:MAG: RelA/SpoT family protein [Pseudomonadota bacterium]
MQHPLDEAPDKLCADLIAQCGENPLLQIACEAASAVWDGDPTRPRGPRAALLLCELKADADTLLTATLGDPRLRAGFNERSMAETYGVHVARMVADLHRLNTLTDTQAAFDDPQQAENMRRLLLTMVSDVRVILVKLAYRLERLRALPLLEDPEQRKPVARETLELFAPMAHRLGLGQLKWELEDLAFRHLEPDTYKRIARFLDERRGEREDYIVRVRDQLERALKAEGIDAKVYGRPKHLYSIFGKMRRKKLSFEQLFDVRALRVQVESGVADCYAALSVVHTLWAPIASEYDDYIAHPKPNGYQSLHTAVHALEGKTLEVQIRTRAMHDQAELGVAAHWRYKEGAKGGGDPFQDELERLRLALEEGEGAQLAANTVYVFTPKGHVMELPRGATPLDLAYAIHTDLGHGCKGAKVNGKLVALNTPLNNADRVELMRAPDGRPSREWADAKAGYLVSKSARAKVRAWFVRRERESAREEGHAHWDKTVRRLGLSREQREALLHSLHLKSEEAVWEALGEGRLSRSIFLDAARAVLAGGKAEAEALPSRHLTPPATTRRITLEGLQAEPARCCYPAPGDPVVGFVTRGQGLRLHRNDCRNLARLRELHPERLMEVEWPRIAGLPIRTTLEIRGENRPDLLRDVGNVLAQFKARVLTSDSRADRRSGLSLMRLTLEVPSMSDIQPLIDKLAGIREVDEVRRL